MATYATQPLLGLNFPHLGDINQQAALFDTPNFFDQAICSSTMPDYDSSALYNVTSTGSQQQQSSSVTASQTQYPRERLLEEARIHTSQSWSQHHGQAVPQTALRQAHGSAQSAQRSSPSSMLPAVDQRPSHMSTSGTLDFPNASTWGEQFDFTGFETGFPSYEAFLAGEKASNFVDPSLLQSGIPTPTSLTAPSFQIPHFPQPGSPALSQASSQTLSRTGSTHLKQSRSQSPHPRNIGWQPYPPSVEARSTLRAGPHPSPSQHGIDFEEESNRTRCPIPECGRPIKDLKAHMLTHQDERPEKCPITSCEYHKKGFSRKYDKNRHTLIHYKGTMVCGFCPHSGSAAEKSFNRADVFKRHLTSQHGVEQNPPNSRRKGASASKSAQTLGGEATGKCSICSSVFSNAQDFYEHLEDCILSVVQQIDPSEDINEKLLTSVADDPEVQETLSRHNLPASMDTAGTSFGAEDEDEEDNTDEEYPHKQPQSGSGAQADDYGVGALQHSGGGSDSKESRLGSGGRSAAHFRSNDRPHAAVGLTYSKGGVLLTKQGRKRRKNYPISWNSPIEKMKMKKRVLTVWDGQRRLTKDDMMLDSDCEVRMQLPGGNSDEYITDLDVQTLQRAEGFFSATEEERGPWVMSNMPGMELEQLMA